MAKAKTKSSAKRGRAANARRRSTRFTAGARRAGRNTSRFAVPLVVGLALLLGIGFFASIGYQTATASNFFAVREIEVRGTHRAATDDIRRIVAANTEKTGVWRSDLAEIRTKIEKVPFVKTASISMMLPDGLLVNVHERVPAAVVRMAGGDFLVDAESVVLTGAAKRDDSLPFTLRGWDETKSEKAATDNNARLRLYKKMLDEWVEHGIDKRVREVNLTDLREPLAMIEDSGKTISVALSRENLGKGLKSAIEAVVGKGEKIRSVNAAGVYPVIEYVGS